jgi:hypothetical protein
MPLDADLIVLRKHERSNVHFGYANSMERYRNLKRICMDRASFPDFALPAAQVGRTEQDTLWYEPNATPDPTPDPTEETGNEPPTTQRSSDMVQSHTEVAAVEEDSDSEPDAEGIKDFLAVFTS